MKKEIVSSDGVTRRIYCGNDFNKVGLNTEIKKRCDKRNCCGKKIIRVLSGCGSEKVFDIDEENNSATNYALTKEDFFDKIVNDSENKIDMKPFNRILDIIKKIIEL